MLGKQIDLVLGLTTFCTDLLKISVPPLGQINKKFLLVIYNDNPIRRVTRRDIRRMGYRGPLHIINGECNLDTLRARMEIVRYVAGLRNRPNWIIFANDNDIVTDIDIPTVGADVFAVFQNSLSIRRRLADLMAAVANPASCTPDGDAVVLVRPHVGVTGIPIRTEILTGLLSVLDSIYDGIAQIGDEFNCRPSYDVMMWSFVNTYARHVNPSASPIYMDRVGYITCDLDAGTTKYGLATCSTGRSDRGRTDRMLARYDELFAAALRGME